MTSPIAERRISCVAIIVYAVIVFAAAWVTAHAYAVDPNPADPRGGGMVAAIFVVLILPVLTGFAIGRWPSR